MVTGPDGRLTGSLLIAQPFSKDEYFWPRPSAASYDASASASSALAASNYALRDRVARMLGPIVKYSSGPKTGQLAAPDIEAWFGRDRYQGQPHIVAQWADNHNELAQAWITADPTHAQYVNDWAKSHKAAVTDWVKQNPATPQPQASDLAVRFFEDFSTELQNVPGDMVTASASGLDPDITVENAEYQLDRVASKWAADLKRDPVQVRTEIDKLIRTDAYVPMHRLFGEEMVNVLRLNLELRNRYGAPQA
jgi:K+-transporting ATPase ATPase C chain